MALLALSGLAARIDAALPQTQCTRCGYPDCAHYAEAIARREAAINRCPPGGAEGVARLAALTGQPVLPLDAACGSEGPRAVAVIDEDWCIGCTLCIKACPTDAILGLNKRMHTVIADHCTGCELCVPACPVDCIHMHAASGEATGWNAWSAQQARAAQERYQARQLRLERAQAPVDAPAPAEQDRRAALAAVLARARARQTGTPPA
ncbi:RnfABCDGE type electron transport complex subunit B [Melaminivora alkalimesophila]|uniref:Electron transport complex protein RnfB n=1 Tax=Melaminivora alkalimesophila TaxID=1165852 RepID=A0A317RFB7_9BURK|nr:RnfABCDGE type electron transport complex subunit B [Melaminivora alkalimesophila]PWW46328.1 electron transport complex protein RnfB [Melaminivora alkalimesophila]